MLPRPSPPSDDERWRAVQERMRQLGNQPDALIEVLHAAQEAFGYLDTDALAFISASLRVPLSKVYGVATFYSHFTLQPHGEHTCVVCTGTACHISGGASIVAAVRAHLDVAPGETTAEGKLSVLTTRCPGTCSLAPMILLDGATIGPVTAGDVIARLEAL
ncbi:MAG: NAD(P)H-dependent oxidoreductase subunit E [Pseudonocardiaceae bacterium]